MIFETRRIIIRGPNQRQTIKALAENVPEGVEVVFREEEKPRRAEQNSLQWAGMLGEFARDGWVQGRQYPEEVWHFFLKKKLLPNTFEEGFTRVGYRKWVEGIDGSMLMVGSTTMLTVKGMARYLTECMAYGSTELGIRFTERRAA